MRTMSARDAKNGLGLLLDTTRAEPMTIEKHRRAVAVVISVEVDDELLRRSRRPLRPKRAEEKRRAKI